MKAILKKLELLRESPELDLQALADSASYVREANELAAREGVVPVKVGEFLPPLKAIALVNSLVNQLPPSEWLTVGEAAKLLTVSQSKIAGWITSKRLQAVNVGQLGKRPQYRIPREALLNLQAERPYIPRFLARP